MKSGIYKIINLVNGKFYIGSAVNLNNRWRSHRQKLNSNTHKNQHLQNAWNLFGKECFVFNVLEAVLNVEDLTEREQYWMDKTRCCDRAIGYNINPKAGSMLGFKHAEETKLKFKNRIMSPTHKAALRNSNIGRPMSEALKNKISEAGRNRKLTEKNKFDLITAAAKANRKPDKWLHANGWDCRCEICTNQRREYKRKWEADKKSKLPFKPHGLKLIDKWPHEKGSKCKCSECLPKKNKQRMENYHKTKKLKNTSLILDSLKEQILL